MSEIKQRIAELERIRRWLHDHGIVWSERWAAAEIADMKRILKHAEKASVAAETR